MFRHPTNCRDVMDKLHSDEGKKNGDMERIQPAETEKHEFQNAESACYSASIIRGDDEPAQNKEIINEQV